MERMFCTHRVRRNIEIPALWTLTTLDEGGLNQPMQVLVPGVWESVPALRAYRGRGRYETNVHCGGNIRLYFGGVSFRAHVLLDGVEVADHYGAFTSFDAVVRNVPDGDHTLTVEVDNRFGEDSALHVPNDYYSYGGITRPVTIEQLPDVYVDGIAVTTVQTASGWQVHADAVVKSVSEDAQTVNAVLTIAGKAFTQAITIPANGESAMNVTADFENVTAWTPETPALYTIEAEICSESAHDDLIDRFGFREITVSGNDLLLNGRKLRLMGFNRHEEYGTFGCSVPVDAMAEDIMMMKDMHANCVRTCHYPNDPRFLDLCDEMGLLVWEEAHARGLKENQMRNPNFLPQTRACIHEMIAQHRNHPSIFIWGCLNECADDCDYGADCYREAYRLLHELDGSRPMTAALLERPGSRVFGDSDVVSVNIYPRWYHETPVSVSLANKIQEIEANGGANKPIIVSEIGAGAVYGCHDPLVAPKWSEERQCTILEEQIEGVLANPKCSGVFLWQFADCRVTEEWAMHRPKTHNNKGVVDEYRRPKMSYATVKRLFAAHALDK